MKLHRNLVDSASLILEHIFTSDRYADKAIEEAFRSNKKWGARDRAFMAENIYEIVRWKRKFEAALPAESANDAAHFFKLTAVRLAVKGDALPPWPEFQGIDFAAVRERAGQITERKIRESIPDWLDEQASREMGERWEKEISVLNQAAPVVLRVNRLKITIDELKNRLEKDGIETREVDGFDDALELVERKSIFGIPAFKEGLFEVQDTSSQLVSLFCDVKPGMRVIDACAGAGGKSLHLAVLMENKGRILGLDNSGWRLEEARKRASRAGVDILETRTIDSTKILKRLEENADRTLVDAPCSGLGTLRRNPDIKWKMSLEKLGRIRGDQKQILADSAKTVKKGGKLIYSTCSILPSENRGQVDLFLAENDDFELEEEKTIYPSEGIGDGFYMARMIRKED